MKSTTGKYFLDTNFLIYCFSKDEAEKRNTAREILKRGMENTASFVISTQVVKEFTSVMIGKFKVDPVIVKKIIADFENFEIVQLNLSIIQKGIDIHLTSKLSFWDSLVVAAAKSAKCTFLLSEDMNHNQKIEGVSIYNPFSNKLIF